MKLNHLSYVEGSRKKRKRVGRGIGTGVGKTCGRGVKGQKSRSGVSIKTEGGQMPIIKRLPKRGFHCLSSSKYVTINLSDIEYLASENSISLEALIDKDFLTDAGFIKNNKVKVKLLLGKKGLARKLNFKLDAYSLSAKKEVEEVGGLCS